MNHENKNPFMSLFKEGDLSACPINLSAALREAFLDGKTENEVRRLLEEITGEEIRVLELILILKDAHTVRYLKLDGQALVGGKKHPNPNKTNLA